MSHIRRYTVKEVFGSPDAPAALQITDSAELDALSTGSPTAAKRIVLRTIQAVAEKYEHWINLGQEHQLALDTQWVALTEGKRRRTELISRLYLAKGYANYRMAELEDHQARGDATVFGETFDTRLGMAARELRRAEAAHPNHYLVLQLLGLVYSEPRYGEKDLNIAEQYFQRAIDANPSDYFSHELLAELIKRRVADRGVDLASRDTIKAGFNQAQQVIERREVSGRAHLLCAEFQTMLLEIEREPGKREQLQADLDRYMNQAERFLPRAFGRPNPDLTWVRIVAAVRGLGAAAEAIPSAGTPESEVALKQQQRFSESKSALIALIDQLIEDCRTVEQRWVAQQRVFLVNQLRSRAERLRGELEHVTLANWRTIQIPFQ
jgi:hypothetical protein